MTGPFFYLKHAAFKLFSFLIVTSVTSKKTPSPILTSSVKMWIIVYHDLIYNPVFLPGEFHPRCAAPRPGCAVKGPLNIDLDRPAASKPGFQLYNLYSFKNHRRPGAALEHRPLCPAVFLVSRLLTFVMFLCARLVKNRASRYTNVSIRTFITLAVNL